ncbi:MAG: hypothetical protein GY835_22245, partial [bacterium]|nr:hypothetical protein [bacterium]
PDGQESVVITVTAEDSNGLSETVTCTVHLDKTSPVITLAGVAPSPPPR